MNNGGNIMIKKKYSCGFAFLVCVLSVGLLLGTAGVATAWDAEDEFFNMTKITEDGNQLEDFTFAKLDARGHLDGHILYTGCYLPDQCFRVVDVKDRNNPVLLASPPVWDTENAPAPPLPDPNYDCDSNTDPLNQALCDVWYDDKYNTGTPDELTVKHSVPSDTSDEPVDCEDWKGVDFTDEDEVTDVIPSCWDPGWNTHAHYVQENNKILVANQERYRTAGTDKRPSYAGLTIWDVRKPANPVFLSRHEFPKGLVVGGSHTKSGGVHHFYFDGRYVYGGAGYGPYEDEEGEQDGFLDRIFFIVDLKDPENPVEAGKWWVPGQRDDEDRDWIHLGLFFAPVFAEEDGRLHKKVGLHYTFVQGNRAYLSYHHEGVIILDITKKNDPKFVGQLDYIVPPDRRAPLASGEPDISPDDDACAAASPGKATWGIACGNAHAAKTVPGRNLLVVSDEYFACPYGHVRIVDIKDETKPMVISHFWYDTQIDCNRDWGEDDDPRNTTPTAHLGTAQGSDLYWMAWYAYGLRGIDISDPENPMEAAHYQYRILDDTITSVTYDVAHGPGGLLYLTDNVSGIRVLDYNGE